MRRLPALALALAVLPSAGAQEVKVGGLITLWLTQMLDSDLRKQDLSGSQVGQPTGLAYNPLHPGFRENGFVLRRAELYLSGRIGSTLSWNLAGDPGFVGNILSDATVQWTPIPELTLRVGQFKPLQGYEGTIVTAPNLLFFDRSILARQFGDKWDSGATLTWTFRQSWADLRLGGGIFNGSGRSADLNAQKDAVARLDIETRQGQRFGIYGLTGRSDTSEATAVAYPFPGIGAPDSATQLDQRDPTSSWGAYHVLDRGPWHTEIEVMGGRLGRRYPSLGAPPTQPAARQHLDQRFLGFVITGVYRRGRQAWTARYDHMDYNAGQAWYGQNPYLVPTGDFTPRFTETVLGWNWALADEKRWRTLNVKVNYLHRTGPLLLPVPSQSGTRTGDSLVGVIQVGF